MGIASTIVTKMLINARCWMSRIGYIWLLQTWIWELNSQDLGRNEWISEQVAACCVAEKEDKIEERGDSGGGQEFWFWLGKKRRRRRGSTVRPFLLAPSGVFNLLAPSGVLNVPSKCKEIQEVRIMYWGFTLVKNFNASILKIQHQLFAHAWPIK